MRLLSKVFGNDLISAREPGSAELTAPKPLKLTWEQVLATDSVGAVKAALREMGSG